MAVAYSTSRVFDSPERQAGEGTRVLASAAERAIRAREELASATAAAGQEPVIGSDAPEVMIGAPAARSEAGATLPEAPLIDDFDDAGPVIGGLDRGAEAFAVYRPPPLQRGPSRADAAPEELPPEPERYVPQRKRPPAPYVAREAEPLRGRLQPAIETPGLRSPMPRVYGGSGLLQYWYVPVAALLALAVAAGVIFAADLLLGGEDGQAAAVVTGSPVAFEAATAAAAASPKATGNAAGSPAAGPAGAAAQGKFKPGDTVLVAGAGGSSGDCLNIRTAPARGNDNSIACVPDGTELTIRAGPDVSGDLRWWKVQPPANVSQGEGWVAEEYIARKP